jgi:hypothetical protein
MVTLGSGTPLMEVFCFRRVWESVGAELFDAFTAVAFLVCRCWWCVISRIGRRLRGGLAPRRTTADIALNFVDSARLEYPQIIHE